MDNAVWPISFFQKNYHTAFELRCSFQKFYPETICFKSYSPLKYFIQVSTKSSILFFLFIKSCTFFFIYTILSKFESWTIRVEPYFPSLENDQYLSKAHMVRITFCFHFIFNGSFFYFEIFLTNADHGQYGLTRILHFNEFLSKTDMIRFTLYLQKFSVNLYQETIPFGQSCPFKDSQ